ncbi:MAG: right-handed parallel beta-helix repeat-containing protein, partial [Candidatus Marinimicrobia bacterium]|nr:right-handed parallel beta-helix repeat-containing protein [Candidatus Neomarinimicrobiota bacterium]
MTSCSDGLRLKNLVNYPVIISSLDALDTLKILPDVVKYSGSEETNFRQIVQDIRIQGRQADRPVWQADEQGCFEVNSGANIHILDFNFQGTGYETALIRIDSGRVILENCTVSGSDEWSIIVGSAGALELRNVYFTDNGPGAIKLDGGTLKIYNCEFDQAGKTAIYASQGSLLEAHKTQLTNPMGTAIELPSVSEVWLDSIRVIDSFQDGISLQNCDFVLINQVESRENGRHGLQIHQTSIAGLLNYSAIGNLVSGMVIDAVDTLRILNSEFVGNGDSGGRISSTDRIRMAGVSVGHNGSDGFQIRDGHELLIHHSTFQANPKMALEVDSLISVQIEYSSIVNNSVGISVNHFEELKFRNNLLVSNAESGVSVKNGTKVTLSVNLLKENQLGWHIGAVLNVQLDSNRVESNTLGADFRSVARLDMAENIWIANGSASYFSDIGLITSDHDQWLANRTHAFEILSADELILSNSILRGNQNGGLLNQVSARLDSCVFDSSSGYALKLMNGSLLVNQSRFSDNKLGIELDEGSRARIVQSQFVKNDLAIDAHASVAISMSYSSVRQARGGLRVGNYGAVELLSNRFEELDDYAIRITGPHLQSLYLRQNIIQRTGGVIHSESSSGKLEILNNTFANNTGGIQVQKGSIQRLDHNIFYGTDPPALESLKDINSLQWNCFYPFQKTAHPEPVRDRNQYLDPQFEGKFYLSPQSPCLQGG